MIDVEHILRAAAVVAAVAVVAGPSVVAAVQKAFVWRQEVSVSKEDVSQIADAHTVLEIARRLQNVGNDEGFTLCQKLIDVMLRKSAKS